MKRRAFTLIELIMAMAATAIILTAIYSVFSKGVRLRNRALERTRAMQLELRAVDVLRNDLRNAIVTGGSMADILESSRQSRSGSFPGYLRFVTTTARALPDEDMTTDLQQVEYSVMTDPMTTDRTAGVLARAAQKNLLSPVNEEVLAEPLLTGVEALEVEFSDGTSWVETWNIDETNTDLPKAIRVTIRRSPGASPDTVPLPIEIVVPWITERAVEGENP